MKLNATTDGFVVPDLPTIIRAFGELASFNRYDLVTRKHRSRGRLLLLILPARYNECQGHYKEKLHNYFPWLSISSIGIFREEFNLKMAKEFLKSLKHKQISPENLWVILIQVPARFAVDTQKLFKAFLDLVALLDCKNRGEIEFRLDPRRIVKITFEVKDCKALNLVRHSEDRPPSSRAR